MVSSDCSSPVMINGSQSTNNVVGVNPNLHGESPIPMGPMQEKIPEPRQSPAMPESNLMMHGPNMCPMPVSNIAPSSMPLSNPAMGPNATSPLMIRPSGSNPSMPGQPGDINSISQKPMVGSLGGNPITNSMTGNEQLNIQGNYSKKYLFCSKIDKKYSYQLISVPLKR